MLEICIDSSCAKNRLKPTVLAQQVSSFSFTVYIPCKPDSFLFNIESWGPGSVYCGEPDSATFFC